MVGFTGDASGGADMAQGRALSVRHVVLAPLLLALASLTLACSGADESANHLQIQGGPTPSRPGTGPCTIGATSTCSIELGTHDGIVSCAAGTKTCVDGTWSACAADTRRPTYSVPAPSPERSGVSVQAISQSAASCVNNPCDPYCRDFEDEPDAPVTTEPTIVVGNSTGGTLEQSNVPIAFKNKGSLNAQCASPCTTKSCLEACQFDQHCGTTTSGAAGCVAFENDESGACTGTDITAPTTCVPRAGYRNITVCNRGTVAAGPGVACYVFAGGSPQYPEDAPSLRTAKLVMTTAKTLQPGTCETQEVAESVFGASGIQSLMCNPPGSGSGGYIAETAGGSRFPTSSATTTWLNPERGYAADGAYATANSTELTTGDQYPASYAAVSGWNNPERAGAFDASPTTATPPSSGGTFSRYPGASSTTSWSNATRSYVAAETDPNQRYATTVPALPALGAATTTTARYPTTNTGNACNNGSACAWQNANNAYAAESPPAPTASFVTAAMSQSTTQVDVASIYLGSFNFSDVPATAVITGFTLTVHWKGSNKVGGTVQAYKAGGTIAIGTAISRLPTGASTTFDETVQRSSTFSAGQVTVADLTDPKFIKLTGTHSSDSSVDSLFVDYVSVAVTYQVPGTPQTNSLSVGNFGFSVPTGATITGLSTQVKWKVSAANTNVTLGVQPYVGAAALGTETTTTATSALTSDSVASQTLSAAQLASVAAASLADGTFTVRVRATRANSGDTTTNPNVTVSVDYVVVTVTYVSGASNTTATYSQLSFGVPAGATVLGVTTEVNWNVSVANANVLLGVQPMLGGAALGTELTTGAGISPPVSASLASTTIATNVAGSALSPSDFADPNFAVLLRATRASGTIPDPDTTAMVDFIRARVKYIMNPTQTVDYSGFGFALPTARDLMRVSAEVKWKISALNQNVVLGFQAIKDAGLTPVGSETTTSAGTSPPTTDSVITSDVNIANVTAADVNAAGFGVRVRATRGNGYSPNPDISAFVDYVKLTATYGTPTGGNVVECNPYNNWSATKLVPDPQPCVDTSEVHYPPFTVSRVFQADCPAGKAAVWSYFGYESSTPADSKIEFRFRAFEPTNGQCVELPAATSGTPAPLAIARSTPSDTQICLIDGGVSGCPVDLFSGLDLGASSARPDCLQMDAVGTPASDDSASATLYRWTVTFDCVDNQ